MTKKKKASKKKGLSLNATFAFALIASVVLVVLASFSREVSEVGSSTVISNINLFGLFWILSCVFSLVPILSEKFIK